MLINGSQTRTVVFDEPLQRVQILDQTKLPFSVKWLTLTDVVDACYAIKHMQVRGAPAIGAVAAYGIALAVEENSDWAFIYNAAQQLKATRPTAINLAWAVDKQLQQLQDLSSDLRLMAARNMAADICDEDVQACSAIGDFGLSLIQRIADTKPGQVVNILTHCNAGWLATVDWGTALSPIYKAQQAGIDVHVWVDETRPRNQGALLTAFELSQQGIKNTLICDNAGGHLMQQGLVDLCLVGSDRTAANGDVCNKIGTYLKALAAMDNQVPFYVALPTSTIDWTLSSGQQIPIESRSADEVLNMHGRLDGGEVRSVAICTEDVVAANPAFDVTPAHLVTALITELGICQPHSDAITELKEKLADSL